MPNKLVKIKSFPAEINTDIFNNVENKYKPSKSIILTITSAGTLLVLFAFTVPIVTLTSVVGSFDIGPGPQAWILSAMSVGAAAGLLSCGAAGDDLGRRKVFQYGLLFMAFSSIISAIAPNAIFLIIGRILQGIGGAAIIACALGIIGNVYPNGSERKRATAIWGAALGAGVALGPIISAWLDNLGGWRLPYILTGIASAVLAFTSRNIPESKADIPRKVDIAGAITFSFGIAVILAGLTEIRLGWNRPSVIALITIGTGLIAAFIVVEKRTKAPMLDLSLFRRPDFVSATIAALAAGAGVLALLSLVPTLLQRAMGVNTVIASVILLGWSATTVPTSYAVRWLPEWLTPRILLTSSLVGCAIGQLALFGLTAESSIFRVLPGLIISGIANGVLNAALGHEAVASVPADHSAMGSGVNNTARYLGAAIGLTIVTLLLTRAGVESGPEGLMKGWSNAVLVTTGLSLLGAVVVAFAPEAKPNSSSIDIKESTV